MNKDDFVRCIRSVVGNQMLRLAVSQVQSQVSTNLIYCHEGFIMYILITLNQSLSVSFVTFLRFLS